MNRETEKVRTIIETAIQFGRPTGYNPTEEDWHEIKKLCDKVESEPEQTEFTKKAKEYCQSVIQFAQHVKDTVSKETKEEITEKLFELLFEGFSIINQLQNCCKYSKKCNDKLLAKVEQLEIELKRI